MNICIISNSRTGSKFIQREIQKFLASKGKTSCLRTSKEKSIEYGMHSPFSINSWYSNKNLTIEKIENNDFGDIFEFKEINKSQEECLEDIYLTLKNLKFSHVIKIHTHHFTYLSKEIKDFVLNKYILIGLIRSNVQEMAISQKIHVAKNINKEIDYCITETEIEHCENQNEVVKGLCTTVVDISNLKDNIFIPNLELTIKNKFTPEFSKVYDYSKFSVK